MKFFLSSFLVSAILVMGCSTSNKPSRITASQDFDMDYVQVCDRKNDCKMFSRLIMGTDHLVQSNWAKEGQSEITEGQLNEILDEAAKLGINFFDTSPIYVGDIENKLGKWMKSRKQQIAADGFYPDSRLNPDKKLYALSKGGFPFDLYYSKKLDPGSHSEQLKTELKRLGIISPSTMPSPDGSIALTNVPPGTYASRLFGPQTQIVRRVSEEIGHSIANLNGDITVYLMHRDDNDFTKFNRISRAQTPVHDIMQSLSAEELATKYWMIGWSNWQTPRVNESIKLAEHNPNLTRPGFNSPYFSLFEMSTRSIHAGGVQVTHKEMMDPNFQKGIRLMPYSPLGGFSIFDQPEPLWENAKKAAKTKFDQGDAYWQNVFYAIFTPDNEARYKRVVEFTQKFNQKNQTTYSIDQMINAYALAHKRADFLAVGPITVEQLRRTVGALKLSRTLTEKDLDYLHAGKQ